MKTDDQIRFQLRRDFISGLIDRDEFEREIKRYPMLPKPVAPTPRQQFNEYHHGDDE